MRTKSRKPAGKWVALFTFVDESRRGDCFYETGGIYDHEPHNKACAGARPLLDGEHVAVCSRCGHEFATVDEGTAEENRDLHFYGDEDIPSICGPDDSAS